MRCLDKRRPTPVLDRRFAVILPGRNYSGRPVMRVQPITGVLDSTTTDSEPTVDGSNSETTDVDVETVEKSDNEAPGGRMGRGIHKSSKLNRRKNW